MFDHKLLGHVVGTRVELNQKVAAFAATGTRGNIDDIVKHQRIQATEDAPDGDTVRASEFLLDDCDIPTTPNSRSAALPQSG
jgi:hypothetical protein